MGAEDICLQPENYKESIMWFLTNKEYSFGSACSKSKVSINPDDIDSIYKYGKSNVIALKTNQSFKLKRLPTSLSQEEIKSNWEYVKYCFGEGRLRYMSVVGVTPIALILLSGIFIIHIVEPFFLDLMLNSSLMDKTMIMRGKEIAVDEKVVFWIVKISVTPLLVFLLMFNMVVLPSLLSKIAAKKIDTKIGDRGVQMYVLIMSTGGFFLFGYWCALLSQPLYIDFMKAVLGIYV